MPSIDARNEEKGKMMNICLNEKLEWQYEMILNVMQTARRNTRKGAPVTPTKEEKRKYKKCKILRKIAGL